MALNACAHVATCRAVQMLVHGPYFFYFPHFLGYLG